MVTRKILSSVCASIYSLVSLDVTARQQVLPLLQIRNEKSPTHLRSQHLVLTTLFLDEKGTLYVAWRLGIQIGKAPGGVSEIIGRPEQAAPSLGGIAGIAFGGPDHQYLYAVLGNQVFRRHITRRSTS